MFNATIRFGMLKCCCSYSSSTTTTTTIVIIVYLRWTGIGQAPACSTAPRQILLDTNCSQYSIRFHARGRTHTHSYITFVCLVAMAAILNLHALFNAITIDSPNSMQISMWPTVLRIFDLWHDNEIFAHGCSAVNDILTNIFFFSKFYSSHAIIIMSAWSENNM